MKVIKKEKAPADFMERFLPRELDIMYRIKHPHIIDLHQVLHLKDHVYIFMELAPCGDLLDYIKVRYVTALISAECSCGIAKMSVKSVGWVFGVVCLVGMEIQLIQG